MSSVLETWDSVRWNRNGTRAAGDGGVLEWVGRCQGYWSELSGRHGYPWSTPNPVTMFA